MRYTNTHLLYLLTTYIYCMSVFVVFVETGQQCSGSVVLLNVVSSRRQILLRQRELLAFDWRNDRLSQRLRVLLVNNRLTSSNTSQHQLVK